MTDLVLVVVPGLGALGLTPDALRAALARGREMLSEPNPAVPEGTDSSGTLVSAKELETRSGVPASWWMAQARERRVPFRKIGRRVRFDPVEALGCQAFKRETIPAGSAGYENR